ncbi:hypothetical protein BCR33DRAFT_720910 [Rhizoclosmatium globosum]|uniref:Uncharacterized protein n=1 Tax=Rhizoclosmatium globosum TaxID=329046 RepID=A0A1Y2BU43_9FUNG|nr:hypothetical protein BCR33DRAFT_720910 [Rhizoclosmatium globosum]|eukprot:ORY38204.1 hypothetical protein BCR33DRAFT_720910 [Rhizoclosmatium globosum]
MIRTGLFRTASFVHHSVQTVFPSIRYASKLSSAFSSVLSTQTRDPPVQPPIVRVWWDSQCPLCIREIGLFKRLDTARRIEFVDIHKDLTQGSNSCPISTKDLLEKLHAQPINTDHKSSEAPILKGAAAFALLWGTLPPPFVGWV